MLHIRHGRACPGHGAINTLEDYHDSIERNRQIVANLFCFGKLDHVDGRDKPGHDGRSIQLFRVVSLETLVWTRGRNMPLAALGERMMCLRCGGRRVNVIFEPPAVR